MKQFPVLNYARYDCVREHKLPSPFRLSPPKNTTTRSTRRKDNNSRQPSSANPVLVLPTGPSVPALSSSRRALIFHAIVHLVLHPILPCRTPSYSLPFVVLYSILLAVQNIRQRFFDALPRILQDQKLVFSEEIKEHHRREVSYHPEVTVKIGDGSYGGNRDTHKRNRQDL